MKYNLVEQIRELLLKRYNYKLRGELAKGLMDLNKMAFPTVSGLKVSSSESDFILDSLNCENNKKKFDEVEIHLDDAYNQGFLLRILDYSDDYYAFILSNEDERLGNIGNNFYAEYHKDEFRNKVSLSELHFIYGNDYLQYCCIRDLVPHLAIYTNISDATSLKNLIPDCAFEFILGGEGKIFLQPNSDIYRTSIRELPFIFFNNEPLSHMMIRASIMIDELYNDKYAIKRQK